MRTVLELVQSMAARTGIPKPTTVVGNTDMQTMQILALLEETLEELRVMGDWNSLVREATFTSVSGEDQGLLDTLAPFGFERIISDTIYNRTEREIVLGPLGAAAWQNYKAILSSRVESAYRIRNGKLYIIPSAVAGHTYAFEYASRSTVLAADGITWKERITADTDTFAFPEIVVSAGLRAKWKAEKGLDYSEDKERAVMLATQALLNDASKPTLVLDEGSYSPRPGIVVPDGNWEL